MRRNRVWLRVTFAVLFGALAGLIIAPAAAQASTWSDIDDSVWLSVYGVAVENVDAVADGYLDGTFRPYAMVTRGQFSKMAVLGLEVATASPPSATFSDVPRNSTFYTYVEGAAAAGLVQGLTSTTFGPNRQISRQQAATILARYLSALEFQTLGHIAGSTGTAYASLNAWYAAEGEARLGAFSDQNQVATVHRPGMAYLVAREVTQGSNGRLNPESSITRAQSAVMILRAADAADDLDDDTGGETPAPPAVTGITPSRGTSTGGSTVVIYGTGFTAASVVRFGTTPVPTTNVTVNSGTQITVLSPAGTAGTTVGVRVTTAGGTSADTSADDFTYEITTAPTITSLAPSTGDPDGGDVIIISGTGFISGAQVLFGSTYVAAVNVSVVSSTTIMVTSPAGVDGTTVQVKVVTAYGTSPDTSADDFRYDEDDAPTISYLTPAAGNPSGGTVVVITGANFTADAVVMFGGTTLSQSNVTVNSPTMITVTSPSGANGSTVRVRVTTAQGISPDTLADDFSYGAPTVTAIAPGVGGVGGGDKVTVTGTGFSGRVSVWFGYVAADEDDITIVSPTLLTVISPPGGDGSSVDLMVMNDYGQSLDTADDDFIYGTPSITGVSPAAGDPAGGDVVLISGRGFYDVVSVFFGSVEVNKANWAVSNSTQITATAPPGANGTTVRVRVVTAAAATPDTAADDYSYGAPTVTRISPTHGDNQGGDTVYITGSGFSGDVVVLIDGTAADARYVTLESPTSVKFVTPPGTTGDIVDISVRNDYGQSQDTADDDFTYYEADLPRITSLSASTGSPAGGDHIFVYGVNFSETCVVKIDGVALPAWRVSYVASTALNVTIPPGTAGDTVLITVTTSVGTSNAYEFTYVEVAAAGAVLSSAVRASSLYAVVHRRIPLS